MKNVVECPREFIAYFNALETRRINSLSNEFNFRNIHIATYSSTFSEPMSENYKGRETER